MHAARWAVSAAGTEKGGLLPGARRGGRGRGRAAGRCDGALAGSRRRPGGGGAGEIPSTMTRLERGLLETCWHQRQLPRVPGWSCRGPVVRLASLCLTGENHRSRARPGAPSGPGTTAAPAGAAWRPGCRASALRGTSESGPASHGVGPRGRQLRCRSPRRPACSASRHRPDRQRLRAVRRSQRHRGRGSHRCQDRRDLLPYRCCAAATGPAPDSALHHRRRRPGCRDRRQEPKAGRGRRRRQGPHPGGEAGLSPARPPSMTTAAGSATGAPRPTWPPLDPPGGSASSSTPRPADVDASASASSSSSVTAQPGSGTSPMSASPPPPDRQPLPRSASTSTAEPPLAGPVVLARRPPRRTRRRGFSALLAAGRSLKFIGWGATNRDKALAYF